MTPRLPDDILLGPVRLRVSDRARTVAWLERVLGLRPLAGADGRSRHGTASGTSLVELRERPGARRIPGRGLVGLYHYALLMPSRADLARFLLHLGDVGEPFSASDHGISEALYLVDPDGLTVEVYADRPREQWVRRGDDIVATIDPLDVDALARAAGDAGWQGVPLGTRMGHVHLYTADLAAAERFYVDGLGFAVSSRNLPGALFVAAGGYHHHVGLNTWAAHMPVASDADAGLDDWSLVVPLPDARAALSERLAGQGVVLETVGAATLARDPWGITVRVSGD